MGSWLGPSKGSSMTLAGGIGHRWWRRLHRAQYHWQELKENKTEWHVVFSKAGFSNSPHEDWNS